MYSNFTTAPCAEFDEACGCSVLPESSQSTSTGSSTSCCGGARGRADQRLLTGLGARRKRLCDPRGKVMDQKDAPTLGGAGRFDNVCFALPYCVWLATSSGVRRRLCWRSARTHTHTRTDIARVGQAKSPRTPRCFETSSAQPSSTEWKGATHQTHRLLPLPLPLFAVPPAPLAPSTSLGKNRSCDRQASVHRRRGEAKRGATNNTTDWSSEGSHRQSFTSAAHDE